MSKILFIDKPLKIVLFCECARGLFCSCLILLLFFFLSVIFAVNNITSICIQFGLYNISLEQFS